jgi:hypothetical protein
MNETKTEQSDKVKKINRIIIKRFCVNKVYILLVKNLNNIKTRQLTLKNFAQKGNPNSNGIIHIRKNQIILNNIIKKYKTF